MTIWFASGNVHKQRELAAILNTQENGALKSGAYNLLIPQDAGLDFDPDETETSFHGNALLKARELYSLLEKRRPPLFRPGDPVIADDSGLCVDALDGRPGIYSARYASTPPPPPSHAPKLESAERNALLLAELGDTSLRTARFVCAMALLFGPDRFFLAQETFEGEIVKGLESVKGTGGFGYDPIFFIPELGRTAAELSETEKNTISHRAQAGKIIAGMLKAYS
ncbi:MAG: non-canonical purine NTP pyrophosphatase [Treponema sp.]|jgi:XTP/dITP diphosphohydrolase|nr:non-canonical purine NTP pyrophosphatase [Treponema sp.]